MESLPVASNLDKFQELSYINERYPGGDGKTRTDAVLADFAMTRSRTLKLFGPIGEK